MQVILSRKAQDAARPILLRAAFFNGFGYPLFLGPVLFLLALHYGADDVQMGFVYGAIHITGFASILGPRLLSGMDMSRIWSRTWWARGVLALGYLLLPFLLEGSGKVWALVVLNCAISSLRAIGVSVHTPVIRALSRPKELSATIASMLSVTNFGVCLTQILAFLWIRAEWPGTPEATLLSLVAVGVVSNCITAWHYGRLPETGPMQDESLMGLARVFRSMLAAPNLRRIVAATILGTMTVILIGYAVSYLRNVAGYDDGHIFLLSVLGGLTSIAATQVLRVAARYVSSRTLLFVSNVYISLLGLIWAGLDAIPFSDDSLFLGVLFPLTSLAAGLTITLLLSLQSENLPPENTSLVAVLFQLLTVAASCLTILFVKVCPELPVLLPDAPVHAYSHIFLLWCLLAAFSCLLSLRIAPISGRPLLDDLSLLLPQHFMGMVRLSRLSNRPREAAERIVLEEVMSGTSPVSRELMLESLETCDLTRRFAALRLLPLRPLPEAFDAVLRDATAEDFPFRQDAVGALGFLGNPAAIPALRAMLESDPDLACVAVKSLLRLGEDIPRETLERIVAAARPDDRLHIAIGLAAGRRRDVFFPFLARELAGGGDLAWRQFLYQIAADMVDARWDMIDLLDEMAENPEAALESCLGDWTGPLAAHLDAASVREIFRTADWPRLEEMLRHITRHDPHWSVLFARGPLLRDATDAAGLLFLCSQERGGCW